MKQIFILVLALALSGCGALSPVTPTAAPPPTAQVIIATVLVPVVATQAPTEIPTNTPVPPTPTPQVIVVTATSANTAAPAAPAAGAATATATLPASAMGDLFTSLSRSGSYFNLRCLPQDITISGTTTNGYVTEVDLYYRIEDLTTTPPTISGWKNLAKMNGDKNGNYTLDVNTSMLSPDLRATAKGWFDYQLVGFNKNADRVGSSGIISQQVLYLKDCP